MKISKWTLGLVFFVFVQSVFSQKIIRTRLVDTISHWEKKNIIGFDFNEIAFMNWNSGGNNSISGLINGRFTRKYDYQNIKWNNELFVRYGLNKQDGVELRKTDDVFRFNSTFGYRTDTISKWYYSAKFNFLTQFTNGYKYPNKSIAISKPFAPANIFLGIGAEYANKVEKLNLYISPLTMKTLIVLDQRLADQGAFGVPRGENIFVGLGPLFTSAYKTVIYKNVNWENRLSLYTDYIANFGNIDVDWLAQFDFVVNEYVKANVGFHVIYDDDIKAKEIQNGVQVTVGPKVQLKQMLGVGVVYKF